MHNGFIMLLLFSVLSDESTEIPAIASSESDFSGVSSRSLQYEAVAGIYGVTNLFGTRDKNSNTTMKFVDGGAKVNWYSDGMVIARNCCITGNNSSTEEM